MQLDKKKIFPYLKTFYNIISNLTIIKKNKIKFFFLSLLPHEILF